MDRGPGGGRGQWRGRGRGRGRGADHHIGQRQAFRGQDRPPMRERQPRKHPPSLQWLKDTLEKEPLDILYALVNEGSGFEIQLSLDQVHPDRIPIIVALSAKACQCRSSPGTLNLFLNMVRQSKFLAYVLTTYITQIHTESSAGQGRLKKFVIDCLDLFQVLLTRMPHGYDRVVPALLVLEMITTKHCSQQELVDEEIERKFAEVIELRDDVMKKKVNVNRDNARRTNLVMEFIDPPEDFRDIEVFPSPDDINVIEEPFLRANRAKGAYQNIEHYLDVQFRLLREDFIAPLRDGIREYLVQKAQGRQNMRIQELRMYSNVHVLHPVCTQNGVAFKVRFDTRPLLRVRWEVSRRLIFGSLVCLSKDDYKTLIFATVAERKVDDLQNGEITLKFEHDIDAVFEIAPEDRLAMAESSAYFEAYRHVLSTLKDINENTLPFQKHIIRCEAIVDAPAYLRRNLDAKLDFHIIVGESVNEVATNRNLALKPETWPDMEKFKLDDSQMRAFETALTKEFSIMQGPPGTGKTYVGLKIIHTLMQNSKLHRSALDGQIKPLLVVCYTNHALDQFLEGIIDFQNTEIIRVGGRSKNERITPFLLSKVRERYRANRLMPTEIHNAKRTALQAMSMFRQEIDRAVAKIRSTERGILQQRCLEFYMKEEHEFQLSADMLRSRDQHVFNQYTARDMLNAWDNNPQFSLMLEWLGCGTVVQEFGMEDEQENDENDLPEEDEDEELEIEDEVTAMEQQRLLYDDIYELSREEREELLRKQFEREADRDIVFPVTMKEPAGNGPWEYQRAERHRRLRATKKELKKTDSMSTAEAEAVQNIWTLQPRQRWKLYRHWLMVYKRMLQEAMENTIQQYQRQATHFQEVLQQEDKYIMQKSKIIAMTTTGAAKYHAILQEIQPKIIVVEEAAEVLEAHIITTLTEGCEHLILIGDHKQLKPNPTVYKLATKYKLDISMFERMINNGIHCDTLSYQHRMRPEIAELVAGVYPNLQDHNSVLDYPNVKGIEWNMCFIDHKFAEMHDEELKSKSNIHEVQYIKALCRYLMLQGYEGSQITILTLYTGQLLQMKKAMPRKKFEGVRLCAVDNFQGEENDIILLSLVRSNAEGKIGFVGIENRVCVALSRAKHGLYVIGNFDHLSTCSRMWRDICTRVKEKARLLEALPLYCQNHKENRILAAKASDFDKAPEGGCLLPCEARLDCGHTCERTCHTYDMDHKEYECKKPCTKILCNQNHKCPKRCCDPCNDCERQVLKVIPACGHTQRVPCYIEPTDWCCKERCTYILNCGHTCKNKCGESHTKTCLELVKKTWPCGHEQKTKCFTDTLVELCRFPCGELLQCGHICFGDCGSCFGGRLHHGCSSRCGRQLVCGDICHEACSENCPPCQQKCRTRCVHSKCNNRCSDTCKPCMEPCSWRCRHYACRNLCSEPCDRPRCDVPCTKRLECNHICIGLCGEVCPTKCRICDKDEVTEILFGDEDEPDARFVQLADCRNRCVIEVKALDVWMDQAEDQTDEKTTIQRKSCPKCKTPILRNLRYGKILNKIQNDIDLVKEKMAGTQQQKDALCRNNRDKCGKLIVLDEEAYAKLGSNASNRKMSVMEHEHIGNQIAFLIDIGKCQRDIKSKLLKDTRRSTLMRYLRLVDSDDDGDGELLQDRVTDPVVSSLAKEFEKLRKWVLQHDRVFSTQQVKECDLEISRLHLILIALILMKECVDKNKPDAQKIVQTLLLTLQAGKPLDEAIKQQAREDLKRAKTLCGGLGITDEERQMVVTAMEFSKGHWYKCPKGHVYAIGECGGANQESKCPECGSSIGGVNHTLTTGNALAPEMDGATHSAYSDAANDAVIARLLAQL